MEQSWVVSTIEQFNRTEITKEQGWLIVYFHLDALLS